MNKTAMIVEDEALIAYAIEEMVTSLGYDVVGPIATVKDAIAATERDWPHVAILDVNLRDGEVFPLADLLSRSNVPIVFHTANSDSIDLSGRYSRARIVAKPSSSRQIASAIDAVLSDTDAGHPD